MARAATVPAAVLALLVVACEGDLPPPEPGAGGPRFEIGTAPSLSVGTVGGDSVEQFHRVRAAFLMPGGNLAVATAGASSIRVFSPAGRVVRTLGGPGEGPGEFVSLRDAWPDGDTIEAWDGRARRITRFLPDGEVETVFTGGSPIPLDAGIGPMGEGWALLGVAFGDGRDRMSAELFGREGAHVASLVELEGMARHEVGNRHGPHPMTPTAVFAVHGGKLFAAESDARSIGIHGPGGESLGEIPLPVEELERGEDPGAVFRQVIDSAVARAGEGEEEEVRRRLSAFPEPDRLSLFWDFLVDAEGLVWLRPYDPFVHALPLGGKPGGRGGPGGEWIVLSQEGGELGRVEMPPGFEPTRIGSDRIVGIYTDELDVEHVRVHPLERK